MKIFVSAAEISSDIQAEACFRALIQKLELKNETLEIAGVGGPKLRALEGFRCLERAENLRVMGFVEVLGKLPFIKKTETRLVQFLESFQPDLIITFDYPDFHLRLMKRLEECHGNSVFKKAVKICLGSK